MLWDLWEPKETENQPTDQARATRPYVLQKTPLQVEWKEEEIGGFSSLETPLGHWGDNLKELIFITGLATNDAVVAAFQVCANVCTCVCV